VNGGEGYVKLRIRVIAVGSSKVLKVNEFLVGLYVNNVPKYVVVQGTF
jgi:hypothetical protein